mmetsp:Transcript_19398/g.41323  ORF Transcript_19398/g.41323 Transcript_19398/m.41323 type:complete len:573 (+) Transcript_19398:136-1854(+)
MALAFQESAWYRYYVLLVLLVVCVCNLAMRNLPSYLITVPVPDCEPLCQGVPTNPLCGKNRLTAFPKERQPTRGEICQLCRARILPVAGSNVSFNSVPGWEDAEKKPSWGDGSEPWAKRAGKGMMSLAPDAPDVLAYSNEFSGDETREAPLFMEGDAVVPWADYLGQDASFYNLADGSCMYQWEYGILIGYGFAVVFAVGSAPAGYIVDRRSRVVVASSALMVWSVATSLQASAHNFMFLLVCRAFIGLAQAFAMPACISLTADYFAEQQNAAIAVLSVGQYLGSGCASFSILFAEFLGWRWAVLLAGIMGIMVTVLLYHTVREPERTEWSAPCAISVVAEEIFEKSRVARMLILAASAKMLAAYCFSAFLPLWYSRRGLDGYTNNAYAWWNALIITTGGLLSAAGGSYLGHRWSQIDSRAPCWIGLIGSVLSIPLICILLSTSNFSVSMLFFFLLLLVSESWTGPTMALLQAAVRRSVRGQAVSMFLIASTLVANLGPALIGFVDSGGHKIGVHLLWISVTANVVAALAYTWTAREISVDPVAAGLGTKPEEGRVDTSGTRHSRAHWAGVI